MACRYCSIVETAMNVSLERVWTGRSSSIKKSDSF